MLDVDLAGMYGIETKRLKESVRRNIKRFEGEDFMFELTKEEHSILAISLRSHFATSNRGGTRYQPFAFTELGVAMLSSVLNSDIAIDVNRKIMRAFVAVRQLLSLPVSEAKVQELANRINELLQRQDKTDSFMYEEFGRVYEIISGLVEQKRLQEQKPRSKIGFQLPHENDKEE